MTLTLLGLSATSTLASVFDSANQHRWKRWPSTIADETSTPRQLRTLWLAQEGRCGILGPYP